MSEIRRIRRDNIGTILKQGDTAEVHFSLYDAENGNDSGILNQPAEVVFLQDETVVYTTNGQVDDMYMCKFHVETVLPAGLYHVEFIVNGGIYPSGDKPYFTITKSSRGADVNIINAYGFDDVVKRATSEVTAQLAHVVNDAVSKVTVDSEVILARDGHTTLNARLDSEKDRLVKLETGRIELENLITNGDFRDGLSGWTGLYSSISLDLENSMLKATYTSTANNTYISAPSHTYIADNVYYVRTTFIPQMDIDDIRHYYNGVYHQPYLLNPTPNVETILSNTFKGVSGGSTSNQIRLLDTTPNVGDSILIKDSMLMNLTNIFGAGNEPTKEQMDELIEVTGYIEGEYALNNKEMLGHLMKIISEKVTEGQEDIILSDGTVTPVKTTFFNKPNLFNPETVKEGFFTSNGTEIANGSYYLSDYIPVTQGQTYIMPATHSVLGDYFDSSKSLVSTIARHHTEQPYTDKSIFVVPTGVSFVRVNGFRGGAGSFVSTPINEFMLVEGDEYPSEYIPFGADPKIKSNYLPITTHSIINPLYGKRAVWNGDSIMGASPDPDGGWAGRIARKNSMNSTNYAVGGGTIATGTYSGDIPRHWISESVESMDDTADYVILEGGRNDWAVQVPLGEISSGYTNVFDDTTFCGALESMLSKVRKKYLGKKVGFIIVYKMEGQHHPYGSTSPKAEVYYDKAREILEKWSVPYLDLFKSSNLTVEIPEVKATYFVDATHINGEGYKVTTDQVERWMMSL